MAAALRNGIVRSGREISRRGLLGSGFAAAATIGSMPRGFAAPACVPASGSLAFQVGRNGSPIGQHRMTFTQQGGAIEVRIEAEFAVRFGFITLYRYRHHGVELWRDGAFQSLQTATDDNGTAFEVRAARQTDGIYVTATGLGVQRLPAEALPLTHWAVAAMAAPVFNPQTGKMLRETCRPQGAGTVTLADGRSIAATRYALAGEAPLEEWYDAQGVWAALNGQGKDGSTITYRRV